MCCIHFKIQRVNSQWRQRGRKLFWCSNYFLSAYSGFDQISKLLKCPKGNWLSKISGSNHQRSHCSSVLLIWVASFVFLPPPFPPPHYLSSCIITFTFHHFIIFIDQWRFVVTFLPQQVRPRQIAVFCCCIRSFLSPNSSFPCRLRDHCKQSYLLSSRHTSLGKANSWFSPIHSQLCKHLKN